MNVLSASERMAVVSALVDGCSIRTTERLTGTTRNCIGRLALDVGQACERLHDSLMVNLQCARLEFDEQWDFIHSKQAHLRTTDPVDEWGDVWTFKALAVNQRAIVSHYTGKRTKDSAETFVKDVRRRVMGRPQVSADGWKPYVDAVETAFGMLVDFGQLVKMYDGDEEEAKKHRVRYKGAVKVVVAGHPNLETVGTSYVERQNQSTRMEVRRFTRKTNAFSKKLDNHRAAVALHVCHYNLCRVHTTLRITPGMALGITDHVWTVAELVERAMAIPPAPVVPPVRQEEISPAAQLPLPGFVRLRLVKK